MFHPHPCDKQARGHPAEIQITQNANLLILVTTVNFSLPLQKNDALFLYGATQLLPYVLAYAQKSIEVVHGPSCKIEKEIHVERCQQNGVPIIRRRGGGGTVVLQPGTVVIVAVYPKEANEGISSCFSRIHRPLISLLHKHFSISLCEKGLSDLAFHDKKVLGSSLYIDRKTQLACYQSSLLVRADIHSFATYLLPPPRQPEYRQGRSHSEFCTSLHTLVPWITPRTVCELINRSLHIEPPSGNNLR